MQQPQKGQPNIEYLAIIGVAVAAVLILFFFVSQRQTSLRAGVTGFDGLQTWLTANDVKAQSFTGGWPLNASEVGMMIIPMFDTDLNAERKSPSTKEELLWQQDEYDLGLFALVQKRSQVSTLIVLPKWRTGVRLTDIAHPELLVENERVSKLLRRLLPGNSARTKISSEAFSDFRYASQTDENLVAKLYSAQTFTSPDCRPVVGDSVTMILGDCKYGDSKESRFLLLSDPDLLNNHGLKLADNAAIVFDLIESRANGKSVFIDYSPRNWLLSSESPEKRERTWADLMRFFEPPFRQLWIVAGLLFALFIWRGVLRFGPARKVAFNDASKRSTMINAFAKVMRISNQNGAMAAEYSAARISSIATAIFGAGQARMMAQEERFIEHVKKSNEKLGEQLNSALEKIHALPLHASAEHTMQRIDELEIILEEVTHGSRNTA